MNFCYYAVELKVIESFLIEKSEEFKIDTSKKVEMFNKTLKILNLYKANNGADIKSNVKRNFCTNTNSTNKRLKTDLLRNVKNDIKRLSASFQSEHIVMKEKYSEVLDEAVRGVNNVNILFIKMQKDLVGSRLIPTDIAEFSVNVNPIAYKATCDGNCLFNALSILVCGNEQYAGLFRLLTSIELYENAEFYADHPALLDASDQIGKEVAYIFPDIVCSKG